MAWASRGRKVRQISLFVCFVGHDLVSHKRTDLTCTKVAEINLSWDSFSKTYYTQHKLWLIPTVAKKDAVGFRFIDCHSCSTPLCSSELFLEWKATIFISGQKKHTVPSSPRIGWVSDVIMNCKTLWVVPIVTWGASECISSDVNAMKKQTEIEKEENERGNKQRNAPQHVQRQMYLGKTKWYCWVAANKENNCILALILVSATRWL